MSRKQAVLFVIGLVFVVGLNAAVVLVATGETEWVVEEAGAGVSDVDNGEMLVVEEEQLSPSVERAVTVAAEEERAVLDRPPADVDYIVVTSGELEGVYKIDADRLSSVHIRPLLLLLTICVDGGIVAGILIAAAEKFREVGVAVFRL